MTICNENKKNCFIVEGKMSLPNQYFAGRVGSKFIVSLRDHHKILGVKCKNCNKVFVPPREYCERCLEKLDEQWVELSNEGVVTNYTVVCYNDHHLPRHAPYILALIKIDGADTPFPHIVEGIDEGEMAIGLRVKAVYAQKSTNTIRDIDHFEPL